MQPESVLDSQMVTKSLFHPSRERGSARSDRSCHATLTRVADDVDISGYLHEAQDGDALLLFFHGNGETAADYHWLAPKFTDCGVSFWVVEYRGYGRSTGTPSYTSMLADAEAILADVPRVSADVGRNFRRIIVMGRSLGSASAIHLAATQREQVAALVLDSPYADLPRLIARLGGPVIKPEAVQGVEDNVDKMRKSHVPLLIMHGEQDRIISVSESDALVEACPGDNKRMFRVPHAGHNTLLHMAGEAYWSEVQGIVKQVAG